MVHVYRVGGVMVGARRVAVLYGRYSERSGVHIAMPGDTLPGGYRVKLISLERVVITRNGRDYVLSAPR